MTKPNNCAKCGQPFKERYAYRKSRYCSRACYEGRWASGKCLECDKPSKNRFCSKRCFYRFHGRRKMVRLAEQKLEIIAKLGGKCELCDFADPRALDIDHKDRSKKARFKSYTLERRLKDWRKNFASLRLLCANCHRIHNCETVWKEQKVR